MKLLIDVDTGIDDALALLYLCASPDAEIVAVTCTSGNVDADQVALNTLAVLELAGRPEIEVALGRKVPLVRPLNTAPETHGPQGLGYAQLPVPKGSVSPRHAADLIIVEARRRPGELTMLTVGPLTNLAVALLREPDLPQLLKGLVMMAGAYRVPGNTAPTTEWNVAVDPEAMQAVLSGWAAHRDVARPVALGLDVTEQAKLTPEHLAALRERAGAGRDSALLTFIDDALRFYMEFHSRYDGFYGAFIHDALAAAATLERTLIASEALTVEVELSGTHTWGTTVTDWRHVWNRPANLDVALHADVEKFFELYVERVGSLAERLSNVAI